MQDPARPPHSRDGVAQSDDRQQARQKDYERRVVSRPCVLGLLAVGRVPIPADKEGEAPLSSPVSTDER